MPELRVNGHHVEPWDPFLADHPSTQRLPVETLTLRGQRIETAPFVLPHHSKLTDAERTAGRGPEGWNAHQGFYVYRERRLLVPGDFLSVAEESKLIEPIGEWVLRTACHDAAAWPGDTTVTLTTAAKTTPMAARDIDAVAGRVFLCR